MNDQEFHIEKAQETLFECDICEKKLFRSSSLKQHYKTLHMGEKNHNCNICGKLFAFIPILRKHIKTVHEGQKNFKCDSCEKLFAVADKLRRHKKLFMRVKKITNAILVKNHLFSVKH